MPEPKYTNDERLRTWLSFGLGFGWVVRFMFEEPVAMEPSVGLLIAVLLFGPGIITLWKGGSK
jgi:hypothetical protein